MPTTRHTYLVLDTCSLTLGYEVWPARAATWDGPAQPAELEVVEFIRDGVMLDGAALEAIAAAEGLDGLDVLHDRCEQACWSALAIRVVA